MNVSSYINRHFDVLNNVDWRDFDNIIELMNKVILSKRKIFTCGNGGSAHTANHYITDWTKMYNFYTGNQLVGIPLSTNIGMVLAYGNDVSFEEIFTKQLEAYAGMGDLIFLISGSGNSKNILSAARYAKKMNINTVGVIGYDGGELIKCVDFKIHVPSFDMQICEDIHLMVGHIIMKKICNLNIK